MVTANADLVFRAVSDPTRRALLELLSVAERSVSELVTHFEISQPAVSQHLRLLVDAGLARVRRDGRQRIYALEAAPLREVYDWAAHYQQFWDEHLLRLGQYLDKRSRELDSNNDNSKPGGRK
jgi:DNA-binding transcriptional ArsR family regulator